MARFVRKFKFDTALGRVVEITSEDTKAACAEIEAGTEQYKRPLEFGLPAKRTSRNVAAQWPYESDQMSVHPKDIAKTQEILRQNGVTTEFNPKTGRPILRNAKHRKQHAETLGWFDRNAGYGDPEPKHFCESDVEKYQMEKLAEVIASLDELQTLDQQ